MDSDLSPQDRKDLDKFIKFFALKTVQVIVQARLGEKICTRSSSSPTGSDWFTLAIKDIPEVTHEAKKALAGQLPSIGRSMCVEISLKTSEGDSMELETWCLEMTEKCEKDIKVSYTVYTRLSLLLKSLLAIARVTPAYKLSRKQGHDYVILYRIYFGDVQLTGLGEGFQTVRVGIVGTPIGTLTLSCAYRTNLALMSSRQFERTGPIMAIIIDHFVERPLSNTAVMHPCNYRTPGEEEGGAYNGVEDSQEVCTTSFSTSPPSQLCTSRLSYQTPALGAVDVCHPAAAHPHQICVPGKEGGIPHVLLQPSHATQADQGRVPSCPSADVPHQAQPSTSPIPSSPMQGSLHSQSSSQSGGQAQDDFVMVDFKPAFSKDDLLPMDLGTFYREFQNPPQLTSLSIDVSAQSMAEDLDSLPEKLAIYEKNIDEFDAFVDTLQ
uniref:Autophagy-related protein 13 n=1 Tax=Electrophorus electricus TaxID=8005 RepID=A0A4W4F5Z9_ELEEL